MGQLVKQLNVIANLTMTARPKVNPGSNNSMTGDFTFTKSLFNNTDGACSVGDQVPVACKCLAIDPNPLTRTH